MALNKSMHPRNRYKDKPPDFAYLASKYPEFQQHVHTNLTGRVGLNFKDPEAVRALTCTLLKEDFGLSIEIPLERLIPTVPLRLNYIHWVEDLIGGRARPGGTRRGIDIGTGASCIYPLLGATMNGWFFLATEVDDICFNFAKKNVENNGLSDLIKVVKVPQKTLLMDALKEESALVYDFCMCNPPFFANQLEAKVRAAALLSVFGSSVNTGGVTEIMAEGGELEFVKRIIQDSLQLKGRLRWYSCMLGKKCSLAPLKEELRKHGVPRVTHTEFCQGRTMRWALAWSFYDDVAVPSPPCKKRKLEKARKPLTFSVLKPTVKLLRAPESGDPAPCPVELITAWLEKTLTELKVLHKRVPGEEEVELSLFLTAVENSWVHIRQRRRDHGRQLRELPGRPLLEATSHCTRPKRPSPRRTPRTRGRRPQTRGARLPGGRGAGGSPRRSGTGSGERDAPSGPAQPPSPGSVQHFLFKCLLSVREEGGSGDVGVQMHWVEGQNRDLMNQLCTYLKNTLHRLASAPPAPPLASP
ncbi:hypothetical protein ANANG_G00165890 [Anguilla anguilla]|uniref:U6 small nuclear RNA (adenine-(43)-N(6))-methyltransferase n=1 Tax=Anguilla anguilla TaxID=7936 RepID=A0A9D3RZC4_ANGAN|nr:hypothetical protein ANANG_G00165890 [Anguilla anguilla]